MVSADARRKMIDDKNAVASARADALALLRRSELSRRRLTGKMLRRGHEPAVVETVVAMLGENGLQSDRRCADVLTREHVLRGHGPVRIRHDLRERGLDDDLITDRLQSGEYDFPQLARTAYRRRYGSGFPASRAQRVKRCAFLYRRGFTSEQIQAVLSADAPGE